jgi:hypothetical protein
MKPRFFATFAAALSAAFLLAGCQALGFFGSAETDGQRLYQKAGEYVYASIPVELYAGKGEADPGVVAAVCKAEAAVFDDLAASMDSFAADGTRLPAGLFDVAKTSAVFAFEVFGALGIPDDPGEALGATRIMVSVGIAAAPAMRDYRRRDLKPALERMAAAGRDPDAAEWAAMRARVEGQHAAIGAACAT